jgi:site-specific DNA-methyltransferase (adenine-specific)
MHACLTGDVSPFSCDRDTETGAGYALYCADALDLSSILEPESVDLVVTSPPYNVGIDYPNWDDNLPIEEYKRFAMGWLQQCYEVMRPGGRICVNVADTGRDPFLPIHAWYLELMQEIFTLRGDIIWNKHNSTQLTSWGSWRSSSDPCLRAVYEHILVAHKGNSKLQLGDDEEPNELYKRDFEEYIKDIWRFPPASSSKHPAAFTYDIPMRCIRLFGRKNGVVLDPFMGYGTTCEVARDEGCFAIGIDNAMEYVSVSADILDQNVFPMEQVRY